MKVRWVIANRPKQGQNSPYGRANIDIGSIAGAFGAGAPSISAGESGAGGGAGTITDQAYDWSGKDIPASNPSSSEGEGTLTSARGESGLRNNRAASSYPTAKASWFQNVLSGGKAGMEASKMNFQAGFERAKLDQEHQNTMEQINQASDITTKAAIRQNFAAKNGFDPLEYPERAEDIHKLVYQRAGAEINQGTAAANQMTQAAQQAHQIGEATFEPRAREAYTTAAGSEELAHGRRALIPKQLAAEESTIGKVPLENYLGVKKMQQEPFAPYRTLGLPGQQDSATILPLPQAMQMGGGIGISQPKTFNLGGSQGKTYGDTFIPARETSDPIASRLGIPQAPQITGPGVSPALRNPQVPTTPQQPLTQPSPLGQALSSTGRDIMTGLFPPSDPRVRQNLLNIWNRIKNLGVTGNVNSTAQQ